MAKKKPLPRPSKPQPRAPSAAHVKGRLERLDRDLVKLLNQRAQLANELLRERGPDGRLVISPTHDAEMIDTLLAGSKGPLPGPSLRAIFGELLAGTRSIGLDTKVAYLGPAYSYSHLAALNRFGHSVDLIPVGSIAAVFEEVNRGQVQFGLVPIENSTDGRVADTLEMFTRLPLRICGEVLLGVHHHLLAKCGRGELVEVYSKPQALSQCRNWLAKHLPTVRQVEVTSTSTAAKLAQDKPGAGAIASQEAGMHYGLNVLAEQIEDNPGNVTRFAVIGRSSAERTGRDRTALMFEIQHRPGALADAMAIFKRNRLNLTWIESFPIPQKAGSYLFFVELDGHETDIKVRRALEALQRRALRLEVLGSFPRGAAAE
jgi:chorismate mutase/prephenate dehydratase